jgi:sugar phosphate permease
MGIYLGVILGGFSGYVADKPDLGWRWAFQSCGWIGIAYALPLVWLLGLHPARNFQKDQPTQNSSLAQGLFSNRNFWLLVTYFTLPAIAGWVVRDWMPAILKDSFQIGQGKAGVSATVYWQVAAIAGAIVGGWLADRWMRNSPRGRIWVSALGMSLIVPAMFGVGFSPTVGSLSMAVAFLCLFGLGWGFFDCNNMPILCQIVPKHQRATGYGIMNLVSISCGGLADWGFGLLQDWHVPLWGIFSAFASLAVVSVALVLAIRPTMQDGET